VQSPRSHPASPRPASSIANPTRSPGLRSSLFADNLQFDVVSDSSFNRHNQRPNHTLPEQSASLAASLPLLPPPSISSQVPTPESLEPRDDDFVTQRLRTPPQSPQIHSPLNLALSSQSPQVLNQDREISPKGLSLQCFSLDFTSISMLRRIRSEVRGWVCSKACEACEEIWKRRTRSKGVGMDSDHSTFC
jgi:hypothetical protein